ncbi:MAG: hypothetical protein ACLRFM_02320 [Alphaproteobacteria bacterium]
MKKFLIYLIIISFSSPCNADIQINSTDSFPNDGLNYLRNEIRKLETELNTKTDKLNKCAAKNKNFKIAGVTTVSLTGVGVATNISLYSKTKDQVNQANNMNQSITKTNKDWKDFQNEMNSLDIDFDKIKTAAAEEGFTIDEYNYLKEHNFFNGVSMSSQSDSDRNLMQKYYRVLYKSKKDTK